ncbi:DUF1499 domain-containing protein [Aliiroseovarius crassostreae]|uniref:DUF1499 domain-containing protein n=1 Tax=Aliiroseovarius crassostreae TaxID=154981 RepID=UPI003C7D9D7E
MNTLIWAVGALLALVLVLASTLAVYARVKPLPTDRLHDHPGPQERGTHMMEGGVKYVLPLGQLPENGVERLLEIARSTPRTTEIPTSSGYTFVTRSKLFGFPDIIRIWQADGHLHIHSHLVIGRSDLGVNGARIEGWIKQLFDETGGHAGAARVAPDRDIQAHVA